MSKLYRQGQVLLQRVLKLPPNARKWPSSDEARIVLAYDQASNTYNAISTAFAQLFVGLTEDERYIVTTGGARLVHDHSPPIELGPGVYRVVEPVTMARVPNHMLDGHEADSGVDMLVQRF